MNWAREWRTRSYVRGRTYWSVKLYLPENRTFQFHLALYADTFDARVELWRVGFNLHGAVYK